MKINKFYWDSQKWLSFLIENQKNSYLKHEKFNYKYLIVISNKCRQFVAKFFYKYTQIL